MQSAIEATEPERGGGHSGDAETKRWVALASSLGLSPAQRQALLWIRRRQRARLAQLVDERKDLSMQARSSCINPCRQTRPICAPARDHVM